MEQQNQSELPGVQKANNESDILFKKIVIWVYIFLILFIVWGSSLPSGEAVGLSFIMPILQIIVIFYPIYFSILSIRYYREKGNMHYLDKIMFYILLATFIGIIVKTFFKL